jgi:argininosuccinate lyase
MAPEMVPLNLSLDVDHRLWRQDIRGSRAWASALAAAGVLTEVEAATLRDGLSRVAKRLEAEGMDHRPPLDLPDEDIHSLVERLLYEEVGEVAGKLHTGRSRNDQVATDSRLWGMEAAEALALEVRAVGAALVSLAERSVDLIIPGYTHLQQAQPVRAAHWALSHFWPFLRDRERFRRAAAAASSLPLGSGAVAGCPFPVDRDALARELGFQRVSENSMDAVSDRDWAAELLFAGAMTGTHLSRLGEDLIVFSSREFSFLRLADAFSTGSSLMPQKRNPDVAELARGRAGRLTGNLLSLLTTLKGLPTGYNRDLQDDKRTVFDSADALRVVLRAMAGAVQTAEFRPEHIHDALDTQLLATDLADYLVRKGVPFRRSHDAVGHLVQRAEALGCQIEDLSDEEFHSAHAAFEHDVRDVFDWERSVESRRVSGGTARAAVMRQLEQARRSLEPT